jgi:RNA polymerase sigma factor (sigma-70 family)
MPVVTEQTDQALLRQFARDRSHVAFAALVNRHVDLVFNAALRQLHNRALAEDVCQAVFIVLARKAASLAPEVVLPGWLVKTAYLAARDAHKAESRRKNHEQRFAAMSATPTTTSDVFDGGELSGEIDRALANLNDADRGAIVLRYLQGCSVGQVAAAMNISETTAAKRLQRALEKLRDYFSRHPITGNPVIPSVSVLMVTLQNIPHATVSASLAKSTAAVALGAGSASSAATLLSNGVIKAIWWTQAKVAAAAMVAAIVGAAAMGAVTIVRAQSAGTAPATAPAAEAPVAPPATPVNAAPSSTVARLTCGVSIELLGINYSPEDGKPWWAADGSRLAAPPPMQGLMNASFGGGGNVDVIQIIARINDKVANDPAPATVNWSVQGNPGVIAFPGWASRGGAIQRHLFPLPNTNPATVRADVATGAWKVAIQSGPEGKSVQIGDETCTFGAASDAGPGGPGGGGARTRFTFTQNQSPKDARQVIVIDTAGKPHTVTAQGIGSNGATQHIDYIVRLPLQRVKEIQLQTRPYDQWMEIRDVCFDPAHPTQIKIVTSDDPPGL